MKTINAIDSVNFAISDNLYDAPIFPTKKLEMWRRMTLQGQCKIGGSIFGAFMRISEGPTVIQGSVFVREDFEAKLGKNGRSCIEGCLNADRTVFVERPQGSDAYLVVRGDVYAKSLKADGLFVYGNIYADEAILSRCVVLGCVHAVRRCKVRDCMAGSVSTRTLTACENLSLILGAVQMENRPEADEFSSARFLTLDGPDVQGYADWRAVGLGLEDLIQVRAKSDAVTPAHWLLGLGLRALNADLFEDRMEKAREVLAEAYLSGFSDNYDEARWSQWEKKLLLISGESSILEVDGSFDLSSVKQMAKTT